MTQRRLKKKTCYSIYIWSWFPIRVGRESSIRTFFLCIPLLLQTIRSRTGQECQSWYPKLLHSSTFALYVYTSIVFHSFFPHICHVSRARPFSFIRQHSFPPTLYLISSSFKVGLKSPKNVFEHWYLLNLGVNGKSFESFNESRETSCLEQSGMLMDIMA